MADTRQDAERSQRAARTTSTGVWLLVVAAATSLMLLRVPLFIAVAETALAEATEALGDDGLSSSAIGIGSATAIALHSIGISLVAAVAAVLERWLGPRALGSGAPHVRAPVPQAPVPRAQVPRLRIGVAGAALAVIVLGQQVVATVAGVAAVERGLPMWLAGAIVALSTPLLFPACRAELRAYARALLVTGTIGGLLCIG